MTIPRSLHRNSATLLFAGALAAFTVGAPTFAQAAAAPAAVHPGAAQTLCPSGWFCVWPGAGFTGTWTGGKTHGTCYTPFSGGHSVSNQSGVTIVVYSGKGCTGSYFDLSSGYYSNPTPYAVYSVYTD